MTVGIPGTGLGGLFYFVLVALMPFYEAYRALRGDSSYARWKHVAFHWTLLTGMFALLWGQAWLFDQAVAFFANPTEGAEAATIVSPFVRAGQVAAQVSLALLALLLAIVGALRYAVHPPRRLLVHLRRARRAGVEALRPASANGRSH